MKIRRFTSIRIALALAGAAIVLAGTGRPAAQSQPIYDYLFKNGHVLDPASGRNGRMDVAVVGEQIVRIGTDLPAQQAKRTVDASGYYLTPGLIDLHAYVNSQAVLRQGDPRTSWRNVNAEHNALRHGVTTVVDGGSTGWRNFDSFKTLVIDQSRVRILAFLNIVGSGMLEGVERADPADLEVEQAVQMARRHPQTIVGIRSPHLPGAGREGIERSLRAAGSMDGVALVEYLPDAGIDYGDLVLQHLRAGDFITHTFGPATPVLGANGVVSDTLTRARARGVLFDLGHGSQGFAFRHAVPAVRAGFLPDTLSTAMDKESLLLPRADMMTTLSKFLNMGVPVQELVARVTAAPARALKRPELGTLREGGIADLAITQIQQGRFGFLDTTHARLRGEQNMRAVLTMRNGRIVWDTEGLSRTDWSQAGPYSNYR